MVPEGIDAEEFQKIHESSNITIHDSYKYSPVHKVYQFLLFHVPSFSRLHPTVPDVKSVQRPKSSSWRRPRIRVTDELFIRRKFDPGHAIHPLEPIREITPRSLINPEQEMSPLGNR